MILAKLPKSTGYKGYFLLTSAQHTLYIRTIVGPKSSPFLLFKSRLRGKFWFTKLPRGFWQTRQGKTLVEVLARAASHSNEVVFPQTPTSCGTYRSFCYIVHLQPFTASNVQLSSARQPSLLAFPTRAERSHFTAISTGNVRFLGEGVALIRGDENLEEAQA